jgi:hypothetical protein
LSHVVGHAAHNPKAIVPWTALLETPEKFLEPCYLPAGVKLTEISKMKAKTLQACLNHWLECVENGDIAFRFRAVDESHQRAAKSTKKRPAPATDDEPNRTTKGGPSRAEHGSQMSVDGHDSDDDQDHHHVDVTPLEEQGKGKTKALNPS